MALIRNLVVALTAKTDVFERRMKKATSRTQRFARDVKVVGRQFAMFGVAAGIALGYMVKRTMASIDAVAKLSDRIGMATEDIVAFQHAAQITGMDVEGMNKSLEMFVRRMGEVRLGTGEAKRAFEELGLSVDDFAAKDPAENIKVIADRINNLATQADKAAVAYYLFGRQGMKMLNLLSQGSEGVEKFQREVERLGLAFSRIDAAKVEAANDAITRSGAKMQGLINVLTVELAPYIEAMADAFTNNSVSIENMRDRTITAFEYMTKAVAKFLDGLAGIKAVANSVSSILLGMASYGVFAFGKLMEAGDAFNNMMADSWLAKKLGADYQKKSAVGADILAYAKALEQEATRLSQEAEGMLRHLPSTEVEKFFEGLRARAAELAAQLEAKAKSTMAAADAIAKLTDEQEKAQQSMDRMSGALEREIEITGRLDESLERSRDMYDFAEAAAIRYGEGTAEAAAAVDEFRAKLEKLEFMQKIAELAESMGDAFATAFDDMVWGAKSAGEAIENLTRALMRMIAQKMFLEPLAQSITSWMQPGLGAIFGFTKHAGGIAGAGGPGRLLPAAVFAGAPRFHDGLMPNEVPAILERGEMVLPKELTEALGTGGGSKNVTIQVQAIDAAGTYRFLSQNKRAIASMLQSTMMENHPMRRFEW